MLCTNLHSVGSTPCTKPSQITPNTSLIQWSKFPITLHLTGITYPENIHSGSQLPSEAHSMFQSQSDESDLLTRLPIVTPQPSSRSKMREQSPTDSKWSETCWINPPTNQPNPTQPNPTHPNRPTNQPTDQPTTPQSLCNPNHSWEPPSLSWVWETESHYDRRSVGQSVLVSSPIWGSWPDVTYC
jgi:hypothetical protein